MISTLRHRPAVFVAVVAAGIALGWAASGVVHSQSGAGPAPTGKTASHNPFVLPSLGADPFGPDGQQMLLDQAVASLPYAPVLPNDATASMNTVDDVYISQGGRLAVTYQNGLRIYTESWQGIDGPTLYQQQIAAGYKGQLVSVNGVSAIVSDAGINSDGSTYPAVLRFTNGDVSYEIVALPGSSLTSADLVLVATDMTTPRSA